MAPHFSQDRLLELADVVLNLVGYDASIRTVLLNGLPPAFRGLLPGGLAPPKVSLLLDLGVLNTTERLRDGSVPIKVFLKNVVALAGVIEGVEGVLKALEDVEAGTTGAPRIAVDAFPEIKEKIVFRDDMVPFQFLDGGIAASRAVAKLSVPRFDNGVPRMSGANPVIYLGTGWLVAADVMITNHHVLNARNEGEPAASDADLDRQARETAVLFDYDAEGVAGTRDTVKALVAWSVPLDYALVRIGGGGRPPLTRAAKPVAAVTTDNAPAVNIIQHPDGKPKKLAIRNNLVTAATETELRYFTDTLGGSSGSPVLNDLWQVIALHRGATFVKGVKFQGRDVAYVNVGTQNLGGPRRPPATLRGKGPRARHLADGGSRHPRPDRPTIESTADLERRYPAPARIPGGPHARDEPAEHATGPTDLLPSQVQRAGDRVRGGGGRSGATRGRPSVGGYRSSTRTPTARASARRPAPDGSARGAEPAACSRGARLPFSGFRRSVGASRRRRAGPPLRPGSASSRPRGSRRAAGRGSRSCGCSG